MVINPAETTVYSIFDSQGTPKSSISMGFSLVNHPLLGYPHLWKPPYHFMCVPAISWPKQKTDIKGERASIHSFCQKRKQLVY